MDSASVKTGSGKTGSGFEGAGRYFRRPAGRVLLREPEVCAECNKVFISLYAIRSCADHQGLEEI